MLYISHLSFRTERLDGEPWHGCFTCVVESPDVEAALDKTRALIQRLREEADALEDVDAVYLESCVEVRSVPERGFMASMQEWDGETQGSIVTAVWGTDGGNARAYGWSPDQYESGETGPTGEARRAEGTAEAEAGEPLRADDLGDVDLDETFMTF